jgi:hypothetical protein
MRGCRTRTLVSTVCRMKNRGLTPCLRDSSHAPSGPRAEWAFVLYRRWPWALSKLRG